MIRLSNRELFYDNPTCSHEIFLERAVFIYCSSVTVSKVLSTLFKQKSINKNHT